MAQDLVTIPKKEYEELLSLKKVFKFFKPTALELRSLERGRKEFREGKYTEWRQLKNELAGLRHRPRQRRT